MRVPHEMFKEALLKVLDKKATAAYVKAKEQLLIKNGLLYHKMLQGLADEIVFQFVVPQRHRSTALDGCHREAAHQGQRHSTTLMQECFWWPGMTRDLRNCIKRCGHCSKYEAAPPIAPMKPLTCRGLGNCYMLILLQLMKQCLLRRNLLSEMCWCCKITSPNML